MLNSMFTLCPNYPFLMINKWVLSKQHTRALYLYSTAASEHEYSMCIYECFFSNSKLFTDCLSEYLQLQAYNSVPKHQEMLKSCAIR